jgi:hypothetical protein
VFVEAADEVYSKVSPELVTKHGLSVDGTSDFLGALAAEDERVTYIPHGISRHPTDPSLGKVMARQRYMDELERVKPDLLVILDADEFYCRDDQQLVVDQLSRMSEQFACFEFTHIWHPASLSNEPLFSQEIVGGFWKMRHMKGMKWTPGLRYTDCHQNPHRPDGLTEMARFDEPHCLHMAFASEVKKRATKHRYYEMRGEMWDRQRQWYVASRRVFETWKPGDPLPRGVMVKDYKGKIPEVFQ